MSFYVNTFRAPKLVRKFQLGEKDYQIIRPQNLVDICGKRDFRGLDFSCLAVSPDVTAPEAPKLTPKINIIVCVRTR